MEYSGNDFYCDIALRDTSTLKKEYESKNVLAYHRTQPHWPVHIVVVSKKHIKSFTERTAGDDLIIEDIIKVIQTIAQKIEKEVGAVRILTNIGKYQDSKHLHFHISSGDQLS